MSNIENVQNENIITDVVMRWEALGFLNGVEDGDKKYLADLYEGLANSLMNKEDFDYPLVNENLKFESLNIVSPNGMPYICVDEWLEVVLFAIIRRVYGVNKSFSLNSFIEAINGIKISNEVLNKILNNDKIDVEAEICAYLSEQIIEFLNK